MRISVIITNYNYGHFLAECIESAICQSRMAHEVIVVDDGSTDDSRSVLAAYEGRVIAITKSNGGQASAMNAGFSKSTGDVVVFVDADDKLMHNCLEEIERVWTHGAAKAHWRLRMIDASGRVLGQMPSGRWALSAGDVSYTQVTSYVVGPTTSGNAFARDFLEKVMPIPEVCFAISADSYLFARVPFFGPFVAIERELGFYRIHGGNNFARQAQSAAKARVILQQSEYIERLIRSDAAKSGFAINEGYMYRNVGVVMARIRSYREKDGKHPISKDSLLRILWVSLRLVVNPWGRSRLWRLGELVLCLRTMLNPN